MERIAVHAHHIGRDGVERAARLQHAGELPGAHERVFHVLQHVQRQHRIERAVAKRQALADRDHVGRRIAQDLGRDHVRPHALAPAGAAVEHHPAGAARAVDDRGHVAVVVVRADRALERDVALVLVGIPGSGRARRGSRRRRRTTGNSTAGLRPRPGRRPHGTSHRQRTFEKGPVRSPDRRHPGGLGAFLRRDTECELARDVAEPQRHPIVGDRGIGLEEEHEALGVAPGPCRLDVRPRDRDAGAPAAPLP